MKTAEEKAETLIDTWVKSWPSPSREGLQTLMVLAMKEQDRDTRHACAFATSNAAIDAMNAKTGNIPDVVSTACMNVKAV